MGYYIKLDRNTENVFYFLNIIAPCNLDQTITMKISSDSRTIVDYNAKEQYKSPTCIKPLLRNFPKIDGLNLYSAFSSLAYSNALDNHFNYAGEIRRQNMKAPLAAAISPLAISSNPLSPWMSEIHKQGQTTTPETPCPTLYK